MIPFGDLAPGLAPTTPGRSAVIDNVLPRADGSYAPLPQPVTLSASQALSGPPKGHIAFPKADGTYVRYVATASTWEAVGADGTLTTIATGHAVPPGDRESFIRFNSKLLGSNITDGLRAFDVESGGATAAVSGAPAARFIFEFAGTVVALDCDGDNQLIRNSDLYDHTSWTPGVGVASAQPVHDGGALVAGVAISQGQALIFQREAIRLVTVSAAGPFYTLQLLASNAGAVGARSVVPIRGGAAILDTNGFKIVSAGGVDEIGRVTGVSEWFLKEVDAAELVNVEGSYDVFRDIVWWRYRASGDSADVYSRAIGYHLSLGKWVTATVSTSALFSTSLPGYTWDTMPDLSWDASADVPWNDRSLAGGEPLFGGFDANYKFFTFSGTPAAATLRTAKADLGNSKLFSRIALIGDGQPTLRIGVADRLSDSITWKDAVSMTDSGTFPVRGRGRVVQYELAYAAGDTWTTASGLNHTNGFGR